MSYIYNSIAMSRAARTMLDLVGVPTMENASPAIPFVKTVIESRLRTAAPHIPGTQAENKGLNPFPLDGALMQPNAFRQPNAFPQSFARRAVIYNADAIGMHIIQKYTDLFTPVFENTCVSVPVCSTVASVTPVAHASMYTGLEPESHGIKTYVRPQLTVPTVYDQLLASGRHPAIVCMTDSTFMHIFAGRENLPIIEVRDNETALAETEKLITGGKYDFISVHTFEYDDIAHKTGPESETSLDAARREAAGFGKVCDMIRKYWAADPTLVAYMPDHGQHLMEPWEPEFASKGKRGTHGTLLPEDMNVMHYYGVVK